MKKVKYFAAYESSDAAKIANDWCNLKDGKINIIDTKMESGRGNMIAIIYEELEDISL